MSALIYQPGLIPDCWLEGRPSAAAPGAVNHGEVFTRRWVVEMILDLVAYTPDRDLATLRAVEPACGRGAFVVPMTRRLSQSCREHGRSIEEAVGAIWAVDLQPESVDLAREACVKSLVGEGWAEDAVRSVVEGWVKEGDFILGGDETGTADFVVGNPPYVRLEDVPPERSSAYRRVCRTMGGRADLFVGFYEVGLRALKPGGILGYICADRWMHNQYGRALRALIGESFSVDSIVVMHNVDAFEEPVSAYPAVTVIRRGEQGPTVLADTTAAFGERDATSLVRWTHGTGRSPKRTDRLTVARLGHWYKGENPWPGGTPDRLALIAELEERFPLLEDKATGTRVGIGVATGADKIFVTTEPDLVEANRLLPLSMVRDTKTGHFDWSGHYLVDPWCDEGPPGGLVDLARYPRLRAYFEAHHADLRRRHIAERRSEQWFRTIDRVDRSLTPRPKLLFPDMKMSMQPVHEEGGFYPHHNIYYVVSTGWPIEVLGGLLLSRVADLFVRTYAVKMRGGTLRFQAQYMRRIRVPYLASISSADRKALVEAFETRDVERATGVSVRLYGVSPAISTAIF